jgi:hypothetical protein
VAEDNNLAQKNWLIRTKNKQILGPATKEKVIELIEKGSLTVEDEITCGNGYWFWVREKDLLEKYLYGDLPQTFNPISEAQDVLTAKTTPDGITASAVESPQQAKAKSAPPTSDANQLPSDDDLAYPDEDDLAYPDMGDDGEDEQLEATDPMFSEQSAPEVFEDNATGEIEMSDVTQELERPDVTGPSPAPAPEPVAAAGTAGDDEENFLYPSAEDLEYPEIPGGEETVELQSETSQEDTHQEDVAIEDEDKTDPNVSIPDSSMESDDSGLQNFGEVEEEHAQESSAPKKKKLKGKKKGKKKRKVVAEPKSNDRYLIYIALFIMVAIGVVIYYYKSILNKPLPVIGMQEAQAQTISSLSKKKTSSH